MFLVQFVLNLNNKNGPYPTTGSLNSYTDLNSKQKYKFQNFTIEFFFLKKRGDESNQQFYWIGKQGEIN